MTTFQRFTHTLQVRSPEGLPRPRPSSLLRQRGGGGGSGGGHGGGLESSGFPREGS